MCQGIHNGPWLLKFVPDSFKTQEMCIKEVKEDPWALEFVLDWFVMQKLLKIWHNDEDYCDETEFAEWL